MSTNGGEDGEGGIDATLIDEAVDEQDLADAGELQSLSLTRRSIASIGSSLHGLDSLLHIDLSRNLLQSLKGLERCPNLARLVVYYNKIEDCRELLRLRENTNLQELDCRLNPLTRVDYYRSFVLHHLPSLRRLDERDVQTPERQRAPQVGRARARARACVGRVGCIGCGDVGPRACV
jgi:hypothetical protein